MNKKSSMEISLVTFLFLLIFLTEMPMSCEGQDNYEDETEGETPQTDMYLIAGLIGGLIAMIVISYVFPDGIGSRRIEYRATKENKDLRKQLARYESKLTEQQDEIDNLSKPIDELSDKINREVESKFSNRMQAAHQKNEKLLRDNEILVKEIHQKEEYHDHWKIHPLN